MLRQSIDVHEEISTRVHLQREVCSGVRKCHAQRPVKLCEIRVRPDEDVLEVDTSIVVDVVRGGDATFSASGKREHSDNDGDYSGLYHLTRIR
jgi:hypothetical protein